MLRIRSPDEQGESGGWGLARTRSADLLLIVLTADFQHSPPFTELFLRSHASLTLDFVFPGGVVGVQQIAKIISNASSNSYFATFVG